MDLVNALQKHKQIFLWASAMTMESLCGIQYEGIQVNTGKQYITFYLWRLEKREEIKI